jgi:hypothetical protein
MIKLNSASVDITGGLNMGLLTAKANVQAGVGVTVPSGIGLVWTDQTAFGRVNPLFSLDYEVNEI